MLLFILYLCKFYITYLNLVILFIPSFQFILFVRHGFATLQF